MIGCDCRLRGVLTQNTDDADADAVALDDRVPLRKRMDRTPVVDIRTEYRERSPIFLPLENRLAVVELVIADGHCVVAHRNHELEHQRPVGQPGKGAREDVAGVEQEHVWLAVANLLDQGRELGNAADMIKVVSPPRRDRLVGALHVVGEDEGNDDVVAVVLSAAAGSG